METFAVLMAFLAPTVATIISGLQTRKRVQEIHVLVNGRLDAALKMIKEFETIVDANRPPATKLATIEKIIKEKPSI